MRVIVIGHSHIVALKNAGQKLSRTSDLDFSFVNLNAALPATLSSSAASSAEHDFCRMVRESAAEVVVSCVGGNAHTIFGLLEHPQPFDFIDPDEPDLPLDDTRQLVPYTAIRESLASQMNAELQELAILRRQVDLSLIHLESPPANPSETHIRQNPGAFKSLMDERGVAPATIRYKLWRVQSSIMYAACERLGVSFLPVPTEAQDEQGMMVARAWNPDPTHANAWYGGRVLNQIRNYVLGVVN